MPGFVTHYIFGREAYHKLTCCSQKKNLYDNRAAFGLGLQGPDIFFYYLPSYLLHHHNIGALAHTKETNAFFFGMLKGSERFTQKSDLDIAEAYLTGFLGHYLLDTICHPYIYAMSHYKGKESAYFSRHAYLETEIDTALLDLKLHRSPANFRACDTISLTRRQKKVIATLLHDAYHYAFPELRLHRITMYLGILSMQLGMRMLYDITGQKKVLFRFLERVFLGYPLFSPLISSSTLFFRTDPFNLRHARWSNPWAPSLSSTESFPDLYKKAQTRYLAQIQKLHTILHVDTDHADREKLLHDFRKEYQNLSFHSGLDVSIPS